MKLECASSLSALGFLPGAPEPAGDPLSGLAPDLLCRPATPQGQRLTGVRIRTTHHAGRQAPGVGVRCWLADGGARPQRQQRGAQPPPSRTHQTSILLPLRASVLRRRRASPTMTSMTSPRSSRSSRARMRTRTRMRTRMRTRTNRRRRMEKTGSPQMATCRQSPMPAPRTRNLSPPPLTSPICQRRRCKTHQYTC